MKRTVLTLLVACAVSLNLFAQTLAKPPDPRLRDVVYDPAAVVTVPVKRGMVTLVVFAQDEVITEVAAIITYLADAFPQAGLIPSNRAAFYRWMFFGAGPIEAAVTNAALAVEVPPERSGMVGYGSLKAVLNTLEAQLLKAPYICGDAFSAADVYVGSQIGWGLGFKTLPATPELLAYWDRIKTRLALARANALDDAVMKGE